jgi:hypothetical protein
MTLEELQSYLSLADEVDKLIEEKLIDLGTEIEFRVKWNQFLADYLSSKQAAAAEPPAAPVDNGGF